MLQTQKRKMQPEYAFLYPTESAGGKSKIVINNTKFVIGRSQSASFDIPHVSISRNHCTFSFENQTWLLTDQSSSGTFINGKKMVFGSTQKIKNDDIIQLGNYQKAFEFRFVSSNLLETEKMNKKIKTEVIVQSTSSVGNITKRTAIVGEDELDSPKVNNESSEKVMSKIHCNPIDIGEYSANERIKFADGSPKTYSNLYECCLSNKETSEETPPKEYLKNKIRELEQKYEEEKTQLKDKLAEGTLEQKQIFEEKLKLMREKEEIENRLLQEKLELEKKVKEMQELLDRKAAEGAEHVRNLEQKCLQQEAQNQEMVKQLVAGLNEKELAAKSLLDSYLKNLQEDKEKLEKEIREQLSKKEDESKTKVDQLQQELCNIKENLTTVEQKKQCLEKELEEAVKAKEFASSSNLKTKEEVLNNFSDLLEAELQCSICNELFVTATILNCTHTFCKYCITLWKKKKAECPVCRAKITSENSSLALDNFIGRMVENLSDELKRKREEIKEERSVIESLTSMSAKSKQTRRRRQTTSINSSETNEFNEFILISSDSENSSSSIWDTDAEDMSLSSEEGFEEEYYGGYGRCYICGRRGHWARGCPNR